MFGIRHFPRINYKVNKLIYNNYHSTTKVLSSTLNSDNIIKENDKSINKLIRLIKQDKDLGIYLLSKINTKTIEEIKTELKYIDKEHFNSKITVATLSELLGKKPTTLVSPNVNIGALGVMKLKLVPLSPLNSE